MTDFAPPQSSPPDPLEQDKALVSKALDGDRGVLIRAAEMIGRANASVAPPPRPPLCRYCGERGADHDDPWCYRCLRTWRLMNNARAKLNLPTNPHPTPTP